MPEWIKVSILILFLIAASFFFGVICREVENVLGLLLIQEDSLLDLALFLLGALCVMILAGGLIVIMIRPLLLTALAFFLSGSALLLGWGRLNFLSISSCALFIVINLCAAVLIHMSQSGRIHFSIRPFNQRRGIVVFSLLLIICVSLYSGSKDYIDKNGFSIPDSFYERLINPIKEQALVETPEEEGEQAETVLDDEFNQLISNFKETQVDPLVPHIPLLFAIMLFFPLYTLIRLVAVIPVALMDLLIRLLISVKFARIITEEKPVESLTLARLSKT